MLASAILTSATKQLHTTFRARTYVVYRSQFKWFMALSIYLSVVDFTSLSYILFVILFVEYLNMQMIHYHTIVNYVSVLIHHFACYSLSSVIVTTKRGSNYWLLLSCNRKRQKVLLDKFINQQNNEMLLIVCTIKRCGSREVE